jgi:hypothetical protein
MPSVFLFSGTRPMPARMAFLMDHLRDSAPDTVTWPASTGIAPAMARAVSLRPAPSSPPRPTTSPARITSDTPSSTWCRVRPLASSTGRSPGSSGSPATAEGRAGWKGRPSMSETSRSRSRPASGPVWTTRPSRSTVTRSQIS